MGRSSGTRAAKRRKPAPEHPWGERWGRHVSGHPVVAIIGVVVILGVMIIPIHDMRLGLPDASTQPKSSTQYKAYKLLSKGFGAGFNGPLTIVSDADSRPKPQWSKIPGRRPTCRSRWRAWSTRSGRWGRRRSRRPGGYPTAPARRRARAVAGRRGRPGRPGRGCQAPARSCPLRRDRPPPTGVGGSSPSSGTHESPELKIRLLDAYRSVAVSPAATD
jgi:hypothetical protein